MYCEEHDWSTKNGEHFLTNNKKTQTTLPITFS